MYVNIMKYLLNISTSLQMVFVTDAHRGEGWLLCEEPRVNKGKSL